MVQHAEKCPASDPLPPELLSQWKGPTTVISMPKSHGHIGSNAVKAANFKTSIDTNTLLLQTLNSAFTMISKSISAAHTVVPAAADPCRASSPPPQLKTSWKSAWRHFIKRRGSVLMSLELFWITLAMSATHLMLFVKLPHSILRRSQVSRKVRSLQ
jgi:hypothetical protein